MVVPPPAGEDHVRRAARPPPSGPFHHDRTAVGRRLSGVDSGGQVFRTAPVKPATNRVARAQAASWSSQPMAVMAFPAVVVVVVQVSLAVVLISGRPRSRPTPMLSMTVQAVLGYAVLGVWVRAPWCAPTLTNVTAIAMTASSPTSARQGW